LKIAADSGAREFLRRNRARVSWAFSVSGATSVTGVGVFIGSVPHQIQRGAEIVRIAGTGGAEFRDGVRELVRFEEDAAELPVGFGDCRREAEGSAEGLLGGRKVFLVFLDGGQGEKGTVVVRESWTARWAWNSAEVQLSVPYGVWYSARRR